MNPWIVAGIAVGAFLVVVAIGLLAWAFYRRRNRLAAERKRNEEARKLTNQRNEPTNRLVRQWVNQELQRTSAFLPVLHEGETRNEFERRMKDLNDRLMSDMEDYASTLPEEAQPGLFSFKAGLYLDERIQEAKKDYVRRVFGQ